MTGFARRTALLAMVLVGLASAAQAQDFVTDVCRSTVTPAALRYDTPEHARWYKRFWTGECDHLFACFPGSPNWNGVVTKLLARGGPSEHAALVPKACRLGQTIGLEWSREHDVRRISTQDLRAFYSTLEAAGDPLRGLDQVDAAVRGKLGR